MTAEQRELMNEYAYIMKTQLALYNPTKDREELLEKYSEDIKLDNLENRLKIVGGQLNQSREGID